MEQRLAFLLRSPRIIEDAVRATLTEAIAIRRMHEATIDARSFANRTLHHLERSVQQGPELDPLGRHELEAETIAAAGRFFTSKIGRRLLTIDPKRIATSDDCDAAVIDRQGRLHLVRVEAASENGARVELARRLRDRASIQSVGHALHAPIVHLFSLRDGRLRSITFAEQFRQRSSPAAA